jgi:hypothetical protein
LLVASPRRCVCPVTSVAIAGVSRASARPLTTGPSLHHLLGHTPLIRFIVVNQPEVAQSLQGANDAVLRHATECRQFLVTDGSSFRPNQPMDSCVVVVPLLF